MVQTNDNQLHGLDNIEQHLYTAQQYLYTIQVQKWKNLGQYVLNMEISLPNVRIKWKKQEFPLSLKE